MSITDHDIDQAYSELKDTCGGVRADYFGLLYMEREFGLQRKDAIVQVAFGGNDYGIDGFHLDLERHNLYLLQFKWSTSAPSFKPSFQRLIDDGMARIFGNLPQDPKMNQLLMQLKSRLANDEKFVDKVFVHFVFNGDPSSAERSTMLDDLREDLEGKKYLIDQFFGKDVEMVVEYRSARTKQVGGITHSKKTFKYRLQMKQSLERQGPDGERMYVGFARLVDLRSMFQNMGKRFFERNIRAGLSEAEAPNRAIKRSLKEIVLSGNEDPSVFAFNHNGVTISAERFAQVDGVFEVTEPRLLNGAQTITTFDTFIHRNEDNQRFKDNQSILEDLTVLCKIITRAKRRFVVSVTINNNRQNPVKPWNLHANDMIQSQLQDKFRDDLGIYYERQEKMFSNLTDKDLEDRKITHRKKPIELLQLAKTFLASDGLVNKMSNMRLVFEGDNDYNQVFNEKRLKADAQEIVLCYKIQYRIRNLVQAIMETSTTKYAFMGRARNLLWALLCQAILNDKKLKWYADIYGENLVAEAGFTSWLRTLAKSRARILIGNIIRQEPYADHIRAENYGFLRTQEFFKRCMQLADEKYGWVHKKLMQREAMPGCQP